MAEVASILAELKSRGKENTRALYARHGMAPERTLGVNVADLKEIAKTIKDQQELAMQLYATGVMEAMYLAGIVANGAKMTEAELQAWAAGAEGLPMICEHTVPWVTVEHPAGRDMALSWMDSDKEGIACSGWATYAGLVTTQPDGSLDLSEIRSLVKRVVEQVHRAPNRVRKAMTSFVIAVGSYVVPLGEGAKQAGRAMGTVSVDMGDTACQVPQVLTYIAKVEAAGKLGKKRKTIRC